MTLTRKPGIFWTWQDRQVEDHGHLTAAIDDMVAHGFDKLLVQPRGCRYSADDPDFIEAVVHASQQAAERGAQLWLHLDPRSLARSVVERGGRATFLIVAGTGAEHADSPLGERPLDIEVPLQPDGSFEMRLDYPRNRNYHVHSDGALAFRPYRLEGCYAYRLDADGVLLTDSLHDLRPVSHLFTNEIEGYVEVFGRWRPPEEEGWRVLAAVSFSSNYPDFASDVTRLHLAGVLETYAAEGAKLGGLWWDEPGYCTGFDRRFRADRGRLPWGEPLLRLHSDGTGRDALVDLPFLLRESDDGTWGTRRARFYRSVQEAVFTAQRELLEHGRTLFGRDLRMGVHQTWHQNADDVINGCADWWQGTEVLEAGYSDVGDAERTSDPRQMAEVRSMALLSVSLARRSASGEAYYNLWGVDYGESPEQPDGKIVDWWVDLQAAIGCNWLAHTYGPTGYFERPSVWGPGYPDHPTWSRMPVASSRLGQALELARGRLPRADVAFVYPLGTLYRLGSDLANPISDSTHVLIDRLLRSGFEVDIVSPAVLAASEPARYRLIIFAHPFGATPDDVAHLVERRAHGSRILAFGLPPVPGEGYAGAAEWRELGLSLPELSWPDLRRSRSGADTITFQGDEWLYSETPGWGRSDWGSSRSGEIASGGGECHYLGLFLDALGDGAIDLLSRLGVEPGWRLPAGALASRTELPDGGLLIRLAPAEFDRPFEGSLRCDDFELEVGSCPGLLVIRMLPNGRVADVIAPDGVAWELGRKGRKS